MLTEQERDALDVLLALPDLAGDRRGHGPFIPADGFLTADSRRHGIYEPILMAWAQYRHLAVDPDPVLSRPWLTWRALLKRA